MNTYVAIWNGKQITVNADTSYGAQLSAVTVFQKDTRKKVKGHEVSVMLASKDGKPITHTPTF